MSLRTDASRRASAGFWVDRVLVSGALGVLTVLAIGIRPLAMGMFAVAIVTADLVRIDLSEHRLPNRLVLPVYPVVLVAVALDGAAAGVWPLPAVAAGAGAFIFLLLLSVAGGMGMGDVKLGGALGLCLGGLGVVWAAAGLLVAFVCGAIGGVIALSMRSPAGGDARWGRRIPFGPFLLAGFWTSVACVSFATGV